MRWQPASLLAAFAASATAAWLSVPPAVRFPLARRPSGGLAVRAALGPDGLPVTLALAPAFAGLEVFPLQSLRDRGPDRAPLPGVPADALQLCAAPGARADDCERFAPRASVGTVPLRRRITLFADGGGAGGAGGGGGGAGGGANGTVEDLAAVGRLTEFTPGIAFRNDSARDAQNGLYFLASDGWYGTAAGGAPNDSAADLRPEDVGGVLGLAAAADPRRDWIGKVLAGGSVSGVALRAEELVFFLSTDAGDLEQQKKRAEHAEHAKLVEEKKEDVAAFPVSDAPAFHALVYRPAVCGAALGGDYSSVYVAAPASDTPCLLLPGELFDQWLGWVDLERLRGDESVTLTFDLSPYPGGTDVPDDGGAGAGPHLRLSLGRDSCVTRTPARDGSVAVGLGTEFAAQVHWYRSATRATVAETETAAEAAGGGAACLAAVACIGQQRYDAAANACVDPDCTQWMFTQLSETKRCEVPWRTVQLWLYALVPLGVALEVAAELLRAASVRAARKCSMRQLE